MMLNLLYWQRSEIDNSPDAPPTSKSGLTDGWALDLYVGMSVACASILLLLYGLVLNRVFRGTKYTFVIVLVIIFMMSNLAGALEPLMLHQSIVLSVQTDKVQDERDQVAAYAKAQEILYGIRLAFLNLGMWFFCFRYWNISQVMPVHLSGNEIS